MKLAVVGSINMDMTVTAERIPLKGETLRGDSLHYIPGGKGAIFDGEGKPITTNNHPTARLPDI